MLIINAYQGEFKHLLSILRLAVLDGRSYVTFPKKKFNYSSILRVLRTAGFIESYEDRKEIIIVGLKQTY
jgi:ribosomal protein S8